MKGRIALVLLVLVLFGGSVQAKELGGNDLVSATGQTTVTAQIEMLEESEGTSEVGTGDSNKTITYVSLLMLSTMVILVSQIRALQKD